MDERQIRIQYEKALARAAALEARAGELRALSGTELQGVLDELRAGWTGEQAQAYQAKCAVLQGRITRTAAELERCAETLRTAARRLYEADLAAAQLARERWNR